MNVITIIGYVLLILVDIALVAIVLLQPSKDGGDASSMMSGAMENFFGKNRSRTLEGKLAGITRWIAIAFGALCVGLVLVNRFIK